MADPKKDKAARKNEYRSTRKIRLVITTEVANDEEEERVSKWLDEFVDKAKGSFPLKDKVEAVSERIVSKPKDKWKG
jgi:hypothetical protein